jgi:sulfopropanediol 3-dehydrogenase
MPKIVKSGRDAGAQAIEDASIRATVESLLADIATRGDAAVRDASRKFDGWDRTDFRLTGKEIADCISQLSRQDLDDIRFAQEQVRNFAEIQRSALKDVEAETLPGVILGHKNIPVDAVASTPCSPRRTCPLSPPKLQE